MLSSRVARVEEDVKNLNLHFEATRERMEGLRSDLRVLETRVAVYAGLGALVGGALMNVVLRVLKI